ncbi:hypothetical protein F5X68DRAFT_211751 [Plectosphaerella plurivora]|uniref:Uncharacterized protein n=1 Tax=Plectosphaerella plurivora TaxID=936078 RepID=A0A9P8V8G6_9PEZI|nr:hypothetical protein F5X68DRAFT_211751 [Plectosphaerella plurivora]
MHTSTLLLALASLAAAMPAEPTPTPEAVAPVTPRPHHIDPTAVWITVDKTGRPSTVTPVATTISGESTFVDGAPNELTGTVFVITDRRNAKVTTSTGEPPLPTARNGKGQGAFAPCHNLDGKGAPFCSPEETDEVIIGKTYYLTFDPEFPMLKSNTTGRKLKLRLVGDMINSTTGEVGDEIHSTDFLKPALHGFFPWSIGKNTVPKDQDSGLVRLRFKRYFVDEDGEEEALEHDLPGPTIRTVRARRHETGAEHGGIPAGAELYIALPIVFGVLGMVIVFGLVWSRQRRKARFDLGYKPVPAGTKSQRTARLGRAQRMLNRMKKKRNTDDGTEGVQLLERDLHALEEDDEDEGRFAGQEGWGPMPTQRRQSKEGYKES